MEADAVLLTDIEVSRLNEPLMRRLVYVGASRANVYLEAAFWEDGGNEGHNVMLDAKEANSGRKGLLDVMQMEAVR